MCNNNTYNTYVQIEEQKDSDSFSPLCVIQGIPFKTVKIRLKLRWNM